MLCQEMRCGAGCVDKDEDCGREGGASRSKLDGMAVVLQVVVDQRRDPKREAMEARRMAWLVGEKKKAEARGQEWVSYHKMRRIDARAEKGWEAWK